MIAGDGPVAGAGDAPNSDGGPATAAPASPELGNRVPGDACRRRTVRRGLFRRQLAERAQGCEQHGGDAAQQPAARLRPADRLSRPASDRGRGAQRPAGTVEHFGQVAFNPGAGAAGAERGPAIEFNDEPVILAPAAVLRSRFASDHLFGDEEHGLGISRPVGAQLVPYRSEVEHTVAPCPMDGKARARLIRIGGLRIGWAAGTRSLHHGGAARSEPADQSAQAAAERRQGSGHRACRLRLARTRGRHGHPSR